MLGFFTVGLSTLILLYGRVKIPPSALRCYESRLLGIWAVLGCGGFADYHPVTSWCLLASFWLVMRAVSDNDFVIYPTLLQTVWLFGALLFRVTKEVVDIKIDFEEAEKLLQQAKEKPALGNRCYSYRRWTSKAGVQPTAQGEVVTLRKVVKRFGIGETEADIRYVEGPVGFGRVRKMVHPLGGKLPGRGSLSNCVWCLAGQTEE